MKHFVDQQVKKMSEPFNFDGHHENSDDEEEISMTLKLRLDQMVKVRNTTFPKKKLLATSSGADPEGGFGDLSPSIFWK